MARSPGRSCMSLILNFFDKTKHRSIFLGNLHGTFFVIPTVTVVTAFPKFLKDPAALSSCDVCVCGGGGGNPP
jgi:hypothetical protein